MAQRMSFLMIGVHPRFLFIDRSPFDWCDDDECLHEIK